MRRGVGKMGNGKRLLAILTIAIGVAGGATGTAQAETVTKFNTTPLTIPEWWPQTGQPGPAPSAIGVQAVEGPITDVDLYLNVLDAKYMGSLHFLLVSPSGESEVVMSYNCSDEDVDNRFLTFDQSAAGVMPYAGDGACPLDAYKPSDGSASFPDPFAGLPGGPNYTHNFDNFDNENANGVWRLYAFSSCRPCEAQLEGGWALRIETGPIALDLPGGALTAGPADPYPHTLNLAGNKYITDLNVFVNGVFHNRPDDIDMVLEKVGGPKVMLMSDACGEYGVNAYGWRFDDEAAAPMADSGTTDICGATAHRPTDHAPGESLPAPAPPGPYATSLSAFDLTEVTGEYRLWVNDDDRRGGEGFFTHKFGFDIQARSPADTGFAALNADVEEGETRELTVRRRGADAYAPATVRVTSAPGSASPADFEPISKTLVFDRGETQEEVTVRALADGETEALETFTLSLSEPTGDAKPNGFPATVAIPANRDATPPETKITKRPPSRTDARRAKFAFTSSEPGSTFECKLDRSRFKRCDSPLRLKGLSRGRHRFRVRATDAAGNTDPTPASARWRVTR